MKTCATSQIISPHTACCPLISCNIDPATAIGTEDRKSRLVTSDVPQVQNYGHMALCPADQGCRVLPL